MRIVELTGWSYPTARKAIDLYDEGGAAALTPKRRGRHGGVGRSLTHDQEHQIQRTICDKRLEQLKMDFALWNSAAVAELIQREFGIRLSVRGVGNYLKRWGFTPQKPIRRAYEQRPEAVRAWLYEQYPKIAASARTEGVRFTGAMKRHWSIPMHAAEATHPPVKRP